MRLALTMLKILTILSLISVAVLSFFPCLFGRYSTYVRPALEGTEFYYSGENLPNAPWLILPLVIIAVLSLFVDRKIGRIGGVIMSVTTFLVTLIAPIYYWVVETIPVNDYGYEYNKIGYVVLLLSAVATLLSVVYVIIYASSKIA